MTLWAGLRRGVVGALQGGSQGWGGGGVRCMQANFRFLSK